MIRCLLLTILAIIIVLGVACTSVKPTDSPVSLPIPSPTLVDTPSPMAKPTSVVLLPTPTGTAEPTVTPTPTGVVNSDPSSFPPFPNLYSGKAFVGTQLATDGIPVFARIGLNYQTPPVLVVDGRYSQLIMGPPTFSYIGQKITFYIIVGEEEIQAAESAVFVEVNLGSSSNGLMNTLDLSFPAP